MQYRDDDTPGTSATGCVSQRDEFHSVPDDKQSGRMFKKKKKTKNARSLSLSRARARAHTETSSMCFSSLRLVGDVGRLTATREIRAILYVRVSRTI